jgi:hypothetical protein
MCVELSGSEVSQVGVLEKVSEKKLPASRLKL